MIRDGKLTFDRVIELSTPGNSTPNYDSRSKKMIRDMIWK